MPFRFPSDVSHGEGPEINIWVPPEEFYADSLLVQQMVTIRKHPFVNKAALMPDGHAGYGIPIGGVVCMTGHVCPYGVGMDIGCGVASLRTDSSATRLESRALREDIKEAIKQAVPMGFSHHPSIEAAWKQFQTRPNVPDAVGQAGVTDADATLQLGTLGGGNHFIEIQSDSKNLVAIMVHSGSRNIGARVCRHYHALALNYCHDQSIELQTPDLAVLPVDSLEYLKAMSWCLRFAGLNRSIIADAVYHTLERFLPGLGFESYLDAHHNYAQQLGDVVIHRKGATLALKGTRGLIPGSMGTLSYQVCGLGNPASMNSCSHGAGRCMSRGQAKKTITMEQFREAMGDVVYDHDESLLDESPDAYKNVVSVMAAQADLVEMTDTFRPLVVVKAVKRKEEE